MQDNWQTKKLGELAEYINGYPFKPTDWVSSGLPIIRIQNLNNEYHYFSGDIGGKYRVSKGDILISWSASLGSYIWDKDDAWLNQHIFKVIVNENAVNKDFFYFISMTVLEEMKRKTHGGTMRHITKNLFENIQVKVPPLSTQQQIVEKLDAIRKLQELNNKEIEKTEELFDSFITSQLSSKSDSKTYKFDDISTFQYGLTAEGKDKGEYRFIRITDINEAGLLRNTDKKYVEVDEKEAKLYSLDNSDLLVARTGATYGKFLLFESQKPSVFASYLIRVRFNSELVQPRFVWLFTRTKGYWKQAEKLVTGSGQPQFNANRIKEVELPLPPLNKQKEIIEKAGHLLSYMNNLLTKKTLLNELFESTLNRAFKGDL